jgi:hypothetical protein
METAFIAARGDEGRGDASMSTRPKLTRIETNILTSSLRLADIYCSRQSTHVKVAELLAGVGMLVCLHCENAHVSLVGGGFARRRPLEDAPWPNSAGGMRWRASVRTPGHC